MSTEYVNQKSGKNQAILSVCKNQENIRAFYKKYSEIVSICLYAKNICIFALRTQLLCLFYVPFFFTC